jgi:transcription antitermination factor NusG
MDLAEPNWYAIYTRPRWEKKVVRQLEEEGVEHYCPLVKAERQWSDRRKIILEPLFSGYVFVRVNERDTAPVRKLDGCINFVYWLSKPAIIRAEEIDAIRQFLLDYERVQVEKTRVNLDDRVKIINGPFIEKEGKVVGIKSRTVKVLLPSLGFALVAELEKQNVQVIVSHSKTEPQTSLGIVAEIKIS